MLSRMRRAHPPQTSALRGGRCAQPRMQHQQEAGRAGATRAWRSARGQRGAGGRRARSSASTSLCTAWKRSHAPSSAAMCCSQPARSHPFTAAAGAALLSAAAPRADRGVCRVTWCRTVVGYPARLRQGGRTGLRAGLHQRARGLQPGQQRAQRARLHRGQPLACARGDARRGLGLDIAEPATMRPWLLRTSGRVDK